MIRAACTIASFNYLPYARTLCDSFRTIHPDYQFYVLLVDTLPKDFDPAVEHFELVPVQDLGISHFEAVAFKYNILELNTNVKPTFLKNLLSRGIDQVIYFDPDIHIYSSVAPIYNALDTNSIVLTPHCLSPNEDNPYAEQLLLIDGVFNLGFIGVSNTKEAEKFLSWWEHRCLTLGYAERWAGLFVDQKWINLALCYFHSVHVLRHLGCNVAYWNLHERKLGKTQAGWVVSGSAPLVFFHFSGISVDGGNQISKHTEQFDLASRPDLVELFANYRERLVNNGIWKGAHHVYAFGHFDNGITINKLQRAAFAANLDKFGPDNPFNATGQFYEWSQKNNMQSGQEPVRNYGRKAYNKNDLRVRAINTVLRLTLWLLGTERYTILMKYLEYVSILRNQKDIFRGGHID